EPRLTRDIDIVVRLAEAQVERLCEAFPDPDFYVSLPAARQAILDLGQFNVIHPTSGYRIDFMVARDDAWGRSQMARRIRKPILPGREAFVAAPEDVIIGKLWYYHEGGSEKHLRDIASMMSISRGQIDLAYIEQWAGRLGFSASWQAVLARLGGQRGDAQQTDTRQDE
ncbi:MAG TPA: hypothetical protein VKB78_04315, partial [Pirellulales bacterium]|nr:hypothetical protein [Pirellulales bacterium]